MNYVRSEGINEQSHSNNNQEIHFVKKKFISWNRDNFIARNQGSHTAHNFSFILRQHCTIRYVILCDERFHNILAIFPCGIISLSDQKNLEKDLDSRMLTCFSLQFWTVDALPFDSFASWCQRAR